MVKINKLFTIKLLALGFIWAVLVSECLAQDSASLVKVDDDMPSFVLKSTSGHVNSVDLKGKVVLINFFATWCPPCMKELPYIKSRIADKYQERQDFVLLVVGREHSQKEMDQFKANKFDLPLYPDPQRAVYGKFAINTIPRNYIVDKAGKVVYASTGFAPDEFEKMLQVLERSLEN
ncbi:TlpA family protein disulfide reductase [Saccharicrinis fermentans]|uniref:Thiol-disulfide oxidoreductase ResA n=1 Tax=Saccharicrinis fermentans DSM 9555 = JCM 21142 TaxID=869213 RepID=W7XXG2_9BACT|nr:TlpA disulfide reductase family protein [Saccharicrinis fermentans]GAF03115.1 thiol-disulfide oxidoreductase ResA [Saccharicrinis fermentans DSM 9555 = JCM 21142]